MDFREGPTICKEGCGTVIIKVRHFNNVKIHKPEEEEESENEKSSSKFINYDVSDYELKNDYAIKVYPNGYNSSTKGQVSLEFEYVHGLTPYLIHMWTVSHFELTCAIAVIDIEGSRRFWKSYGYIFDPTQGKLPKFLVNYVERDFLLERADELLPGDIFTLHVDVVVREHHAQGRLKDIDFFKWVTGNCKSENDEKGQSHIYIPLNSDITKRLAKESCYVRRLTAWKLLEAPRSAQRSWKMPSEEYSNFVLMVSILWCQKVQSITLRFSFQEILDVYAWAYFYGIKSVIDTCRRWLRLVCRTSEDILEINRLANSTNDDKLRKIAEKASRRDDVQGSCPRNRTMPQDGEWTYNVEEYPNSGTCFLFKLRRHMKSMKWEVPEHISEVSNCYL